VRASVLFVLLLPPLFACSDKESTRGEADDARGSTAEPVDEDGDGYPADEDCDDTDPAVSAPSEWFADTDGDGFGDPNASTLSCVAPADHVSDDTDCDDARADVNPGATEVCDVDDVDEDCSGSADDDDPDTDGATMTTWYADADGDGYGVDRGRGTTSCEQPEGTVVDNSDCDDDSVYVNPAMTEVCNGVDDDCSRTTSESGLVTWFDADGAYTDLTATFDGRADSPTAYTTTGDGYLWFCDDTFYTNLTIDHNVVVGGSGNVELNGAYTDSVVSLRGEDLGLRVQDLTLRHGYSVLGGGLRCIGYDTSTNVTLDNVHVVQNLGYIDGAGVFASGCALDIHNSTIEHNGDLLWGQSGGGVHLEDQSVGSITGSVLRDNAAQWGGGLTVADDAVLVIEDTLVQGNFAEYDGGGADVRDASSLTCIGDASTAAGFVDNFAWRSGGGVLWEANTASFSAEGCDFGTLGAGDDNDAFDVASQDPVTGGELYAYNFGDDATVDCSGERCGVSTDFGLPGPHYGDFTAIGDYPVRGNVFEVVGTPTLESFRMELEVASSCEVTFLLDRSDDGGSSWSTEWTSSLVAITPSDVEAESGRIGIPLVEGELVALTMLWSNAWCGTPGFPTYASAVGDSVGIGTWHGSVAYEGRYDVVRDGYDPAASYGYGTTLTVSVP